MNDIHEYLLINLFTSLTILPCVKRKKLVATLYLFSSFLRGNAFMFALLRVHA